MMLLFSGFWRVFLLAGVLSGYASAQGLPSRDTIEIADGVYVGVGYVSNNMGFVVTDEGVLVIDTGMSPQLGREFLASIRKVTAKPIRYVVYTHYHYDHVAGAGAFRENDTVFIAHENLVKNFDTLKKLERVNQEALGTLVDAPLVYPDSTFRDRLTLEFGGKTIRLIHIKAETDDAVLVYLTQDRILFFGDMTNNNLGSPAMPEGYPEGLVEAIDLVDSLDVDIFVPGHGFMSNTGMDTLHAVKQVTRYLVKEIKDRVDEGLDLEETQAAVTMPAEFEGNALLEKTFLNSKEQYVNRLHRRYTGYFGKDPIRFSPAPKKERDRLFAEIAGGEEELLRVAGRLVEQQRYQLALEVLDIVTTNEPSNQSAHALKGQAFLGLARATRHNWHAMVVYMNAAKKEKELAARE